MCSGDARSEPYELDLAVESLGHVKVVTQIESGGMDPPRVASVSVRSAISTTG
jgi:hypothetical protein